SFGSFNSVSYFNSSAPFLNSFLCSIHPLCFFSQFQFLHFGSFPLPQFLKSIPSPGLSPDLKCVLSLNKSLPSISCLPNKDYTDCSLLVAVIRLLEFLAADKAFVRSHFKEIRADSLPP